MNNHSQNSRSRIIHSQRGFTLVEVLVAMIVLSIALLGIAKLMMFASRSNDSAYLRSQATELGYEILDTMRANRQTAINHGYDIALGTMPSAPASCLQPTVCSNASLALYDVYTWKQRLGVSTGGSLPSGQGSIVTTTSGTSPTVTTATITVQWDDAVAQSSFGATTVGTAAPMSITLETIL
jgi:type IV pilus assembly protein PilV